MIYDCPVCENNTLCSVAEHSGITFYSCSTEKCRRYARLFVDIGMDDEHEFMLYDDVISAINNVLQDVTLTPDDE